MSESPELNPQAVIGPVRRPRDYPRLKALSRMVLTAALFVMVCLALLLIGGLIVFWRLETNWEQWSIDARNRADAPCTLIITLDSPGGRRLEFKDLPSEKTYADRELIKEPGSTHVYEIRVIGSEGRERSLTLDKDLPRGSELKIEIDPHLNIHTDIDFDAHVGFD
jgi:hypothetical protein